MPKPPSKSTGSEASTPSNSQSSPQKRSWGRKKSTGEETLPPSFQRIRRAGSTIARTPPLSGSALAEIIEQHGPISAEAMRAYSAAPNECDDTVDHAYMSTKAAAFHLRVGPNYKKKKTKAPSAPALYDLISMDFIKADTFLNNAKDAIRLPRIPGVTDVDTGHAHIPPVFVVNSWLPIKDNGAFSNGQKAKPSYICVFVFAIEEWVVEELKDIDQASPAVRLFAEWCQLAETDEECKGRFKAIGVVEEMEKLGVPGFIIQYNGKPTLINKSGTFTRHDDYIELSINVHMWSYPARKGLLTLLPSFPKMVLNVGFTIEGRKDDELPEVLLGGCRLVRLDPAKAIIDGVHDNADSSEQGGETDIATGDKSTGEELNDEIGSLSVKEESGEK